MKNIILGIYLLLSSSGLVLFKLGANENPIISFTEGIFGIKLSYLSLLGILCYGFSFFVYLGLISRFNLSYIVPLTTGIMQIIILLASFYIFKENITFYNIIGVILVIAGVIFINQ